MNFLRRRIAKRLSGDPLVGLGFRRLQGGIERKTVSARGTKEEKRLEMERKMVRDLASGNLVRMRRSKASGRRI